MGNQVSQGCRCRNEKYHTVVKDIIYCNIEDKLLYLACDRRNRRQILAQETLEATTLSREHDSGKMEITYIIMFIPATNGYGGYYVLALIDDKDDGILSLIWSPHDKFDAIPELRPLWYPSYGLITQTGKSWNRGNEAMLRHAREWIISMAITSLERHLPPVLYHIVLSYCPVELFSQ